MRHPGLGAGAGDIASRITRAVGGAARSSVRSVTFRSAVSPEATFTGSEIFGPSAMINVRTGEPATPSEIAQARDAEQAIHAGVAPPPGAPILAPAPGRRFQFNEALMRFIKPEVEVDTPIGRFSVAPYGRPKINFFWPVVIIGGAGVLGLTYVAVRGLARRLR